MMLTLAPVVCTMVIVSCGSTSGSPPPIGGTYQGGQGTGDPGGGGGGTSENECEKQKGTCTLAGNASEGGSSCPVQLDESCGPGSLTDADPPVPVLICCTGYNDAGAPEPTAVDAPAG
jgi:hypothetical protein